jgi:trans-aconitate methyltransferase
VSDETIRRATFEGITCSAPDARAARMAEMVFEQVPDRSAPIRVLDLGCGTGALLFRLAAALPHATCVGIDISPANIAAAEAARQQQPQSGRLSFQAADYLDWRTEPFDLIVIDGVLHLIPCDTDALVAKLAHDLKPHGILVNVMPYTCAYNEAFAILRKILRATRTRLTDAAILRVGRLLHGEMRDELLRERIHYMYLPPQRMMSHTLAGQMERRGLRLVDRRPLRSSSLAQLKHQLTILRKDANAPCQDPV